MKVYGFELDRAMTSVLVVSLDVAISLIFLLAVYKLRRYEKIVI